MFEVWRFLPTVVFVIAPKSMIRSYCDMTSMILDGIDSSDVFSHHLHFEGRQVGSTTQGTS